MAGSHKQDDLLRILEEHGKQFLGAFSSQPFKGKRKEEPELETRSAKKQKLQDLEEEEWSGFSSHLEDDEGDSTDYSNADGEGSSSSHRSLAPQPSVVVFTDQHPQAGPSTAKMSKAQMKAFMSSKVTKLTQDVQEGPSESEDDNEEDELTNAQNDALLHRLVHTRILSGSLNPELGLTPAQRKKELAGRVLEAAGKSKLGKGESQVRIAERNKAAKRVREGMVAKQKERNQKSLEEAKQLGNYHPTLKGLFDASSQAQSRTRKREKGLKMGVGSFKGGILKLRKEDINSIQGGGNRGQQGSRKRGGKR